MARPGGLPDRDRRRLLRRRPVGEPARAPADAAAPVGGRGRGDRLGARHARAPRPPRPSRPPASRSSARRRPGSFSRARSPRSSRTSSAPSASSPCSPGDVLDLDGVECRVVPAIHGVTMDDAYGDGSALEERAALRRLRARRRAAPLPRRRHDRHGRPASRRSTRSGSTSRCSRSTAATPSASRAASSATWTPPRRSSSRLRSGRRRSFPYHWDGFAGNTVTPGRHGRRWPPGASTSSCRAASGRSSFPDAARPASRGVVPREAREYRPPCRRSASAPHLGRVLVTGRDPVEDRPVERKRPTPRPLRSRRQLERRPQDGAQDPAEVPEELVVARGEDPRVELAGRRPGTPSGRPRRPPSPRTRR